MMVCPVVVSQGPELLPNHNYDTPSQNNAHNHNNNKNNDDNHSNNNSLNHNNNVAKFFEQLAQDEVLHQKVDAVNWMAEGDGRGLAILSRTLFLLTMGMKEERDEAKQRAAQQSVELRELRKRPCGRCSHGASEPAQRQVKTIPLGQQTPTDILPLEEQNSASTSAHGHQTPEKSPCVTLDLAPSPTGGCHQTPRKTSSRVVRNSTPETAPEGGQMLRKTSVSNEKYKEPKTTRKRTGIYVKFIDFPSELDITDDSLSNNIKELKTNNGYGSLALSPIKQSSSASNEALPISTQQHCSNVLHRPYSKLSLQKERVLAPETQEFDKSLLILPHNAIRSVPETIDMEYNESVNPNLKDYDTNFFDESRDVFEDSADVESPTQFISTKNDELNQTECTQALTCNHLSPILGKNTSQTGVSHKVKVRRRKNLTFASITKNIPLTGAESIQVTVKNADNLSEHIDDRITISSPAKEINTIMPQYIADTADHQSADKVVNITMSQVVTSEQDDRPPSMVQVVPQKDTISQPIGSEVLIKSASLTNQKFINLTKQLKNTRSDDCIISETESESHGALIAKKQSVIDLVSSNDASLPMEAAASGPVVKQPRENKKKICLSPSKYITPKSMKGFPKNKLFNNNEMIRKSPSKQPSKCSKSVDEDCRITRDSKKKYAKMKPVGSKSPNKFTKIQRTNSANGVTVLNTSSKIYDRIDIEPPTHGVKKHFIQTKITPFCFTSSKRKGNMPEEDDAILAAAKVESLETMQLEDRRRAQLLHPACRRAAALATDSWEDNLLQDNLAQHGGGSSQTRVQMQGQSLTVTDPHSEDNNIKVNGVHGDGGVLARKRKNEDESVKGSNITKKRSKCDESPLTMTQAMSAINVSISPQSEGTEATSSRQQHEFTPPGRQQRASGPLLQHTKTVKSKEDQSKVKDKHEKKSKTRKAKHISLEREEDKEKLEENSKGEQIQSKSKHRKKSKSPSNVLSHDDSFDRLPRGIASPAYAYVAAVAQRNKGKRRAMPGWSCKACHDYYQHQDLSQDQLREYMDKCSKHRSKHKPPPSTPDGFWEPTMSD